MLSVVLSKRACLFLIVGFFFCIYLWYALDFACTVQHLPAVNRMACVWHAFATVTGRHSCVSCCTLTSFERGLSCIPRFGT